MTVLQGKQIVLGVTGSIACYKSIDLASKLTQAGAHVDVILTESACRFVTPLSFRSVTGRPVYTDMWDLDDHVRHVGLGESADALIIAPATANTLAKMATGFADNLLLLTTLAARCPVIIAPAMDGGMWEHAATQANITTLRKRGVIQAGPAAGRMASGLSGLGRMLEPAELLGELRLLLARGGKLTGRRVVVSAGPTREPIDPVRFITNRSTGKQGLAVAQAALDAGAEVTLIAGPACEQVPYGAKLIRVQTTQEMGEAVLAQAEGADALFMVAAVADFKPRTTAERKIKKSDNADEYLRIELEKTLDILVAVKDKRKATGFPKVVLGFAAETHDAANYGNEKLQRKGLDFIAINDVTAEGAGFAVDTNRILLLGTDGVVEEMPLLSKAEVAERIVQHVARALDEL
ncbi:MAG: bifunctional phosphopantothenoylcysteine decarboxylase/phosphopantothenate--cysteine ligase CoaBC [Anaerolineae bacterium]|nr:bifunctional phosphopantothenoylcysteine decarboxylase/phosphopantothenate--cysteine ligase CoaBC [Anaerolineae bacterium]RIK16624.1 MAG: bifunctional phosphopantothenoylcysteine decarboxylase/phosphopantothenate--cysteine ligase CoaBC [Anaerolineae bacterium]